MPPDDFCVRCESDPLVDFLLVRASQVEAHFNRGDGPGGIRNDQVNPLDDATRRQVNQRSVRVNRARGSRDGDC